MKKFLTICSAMICSLSLTAQEELNLTDTLDTPKKPQITMAMFDIVDDGNEDEDPEELVDSTKFTRRNYATGFNGLDYILDHRYIPTDDKVKKGWTENLWIEGGLAIEGTSKNSDFYSFGPTSSISFGIGKQFSPKHSARVNVFAGANYRDTKNWFLWKVGAKADWLYDFSSHFNGFRSDRPITVSSLMGVGLTRSNYDENYGRGSHTSRTSYDFHTGLQLRLLVGPQAAIAFEPYLGISSNSFTKNWKGFQSFYGANLNYIYYFDYRYSAAKQREIIANRLITDEIAYDSTLYSWRKPFFIEISNSINLGASDYREGIGNAGLGWAVKAGQWLSSAIGVRGTISTENFTNRRVPVIQNGETKDMYEGGSYWEARAEGLLNPFGLKKHYDWSSKWGLNFVGGMKIGLLWHNGSYAKNAGGHYHKTQYYGYTLGAQAWLRLSDVVEAFAEPRFEHNIFHDRYEYVDDRNKLLNDNVLSLEVGLRVSTRSRKYVDWTTIEEEDYEQMMKKFVVGAGLGFNYLPYRERYDAPFKLGFNGLGFAEYHLTALHGVRGAIEWGRNPSMVYINGQQTNVCHEDFKVSLSYMLNLSNAFGAINPDGRKFEAFLFAGPTASLLIRNSKVHWKPTWSAHIGAKLLYNINENWGVHVTPTFYALLRNVSWLGGSMVNTNDPESVYYGLPTREVTTVETLNIGVQYSF